MTLVLSLSLPPGLGPELKLELETLQKSLNINTIFLNWEDQMKAREFKVAGPVLTTVKSGDKLALAVNFDSDIADVYSEVRASTPDVIFVASIYLFHSRSFRWKNWVIIPHLT